jgi:hypothetical protein
MSNPHSTREAPLLVEGTGRDLAADRPSAWTRGGRCMDQGIA